MSWQLGDPKPVCNCEMGAGTWPDCHHPTCPVFIDQRAVLVCNCWAGVDADFVYHLPDCPVFMAQRKEQKMPVKHNLKIDAALYEVIQNGSKTFDIRRDDRHFQCGDTVSFSVGSYAPQQPSNGWGTPAAPPMPPAPAGASTEFRIGFVLRGGQYGLEPGYVAFSLLPALGGKL